MDNNTQELFSNDIQVYNSIRSANEGYTKPDKKKNRTNKFINIYKLISIFSLALTIVILLIFIYYMDYTSDKISTLEIKMENLEDYVSTTYNMSLEEINNIVGDYKSDDVDNDSEKEDSNVSENTSTVSSSIEASDEEKVVEEDIHYDVNDVSGYDYSTVSTKLNEEKVIEGYFNSVNTFTYADGSVGYTLQIFSVDEELYLLDNHNIKTSDSKPYRQYELISSIDPRLIHTGYKCSITLDKYNEEKIDNDTKAVLDSYEVYYITTYKGIGN